MMDGVKAGGVVQIPKELDVSSDIRFRDESGVFGWLSDVFRQSYNRAHSDKVEYAKNVVRSICFESNMMFTLFCSTDTFSVQVCVFDFDKDNKGSSVYDFTDGVDNIGMLHDCCFNLMGSCVNKVHYYRLEATTQGVGCAFSEPMFHLHVGGNYEPRIPWLPRGDANVTKVETVLDFFDFIYRNHRHGDWVLWLGGLIENEVAKMPRLSNSDKDSKKEMLDSFIKDFDSQALVDKANLDFVLGIIRKYKLELIGKLKLDVNSELFPAHLSVFY